MASQRTSLNHSPRTRATASIGAAGFCALLLLASCTPQPGAVAGSGNAGPSGSGPSGIKIKAQLAADNGPVEISNASGGYLAGLHAEHLGDVVDAAEFLKYSLKDDPDNPDLMQRSFLLTLGEGRIDDALALAKHINEKLPESPIPVLTLAVNDFKHGNYPAAEARMKALPDTGLNKFFVPLTLAWLRSAQGDTDGALKALDPLSQNSGFAVLHDLHAGLINDIAGRSKAAEDDYKSAIDSSQGGALRLVQALGSLYERTGRGDDAKKLYEDYIKQNPDTVLLDVEMKRLADKTPADPLIHDATEGMAEALFNVASTLQQQGASLLGLDYARLALTLKPEYPVCQVLIADIFDGQGRPDEATKIFQALPKDSPFFWLGRMRMALDIDAQGQTDQAVAQLNQMAAEKPDRVDALITLGDIFRAHEQYKEAVDAYTRALDRIPTLEERHWAILYARGIVNERSGRWPQAEADFLKALDLRPDQPYVLNYLAYSWVEQGVHLDKARKMLERAVELRPNDGFIVDSLGWILLSMGEKTEAVSKLEQAVELEPQDATINDHLGDAYWKVGRQAEARFQWRRALALKPDSATKAKIEAKLQNGLTMSRVEDHGT